MIQDFKNICSKKGIDMPCLIDIPVKFVGLLSLILARSAMAITAFLPLLVNLMINIPYFN